jgi:carboxypeptidase C (cathepsin A)
MKFSLTPVQPNQVGFSYDVPTNGTLNLINETYADPPVPGMEDSQKSWQVLNGTFSSLNGSQTANTTELASMAVWHMIQGFFGTFPQYRFSANRTVGINLFAESYGGRYGPVFAETFNNQNALRAQGSLPRNSTFALQLQSLGIINGCVDTETQTPYYPLFASDNTYGFQAISSTEADLYEAQFSESGGCQDLLAQCLTNVDASDPSGGGNVSSVNSVCEDALQACDQISQPYYNSGRSPYDMAAPFTSPFPPDTYLEYLNQGSIQGAIGSPINFTTTSGAVFSDFMNTGDMARGGDIERLAALLANGTKIGLMYGDRDYICNWYGGEAVSKSIANAAGGSYAAGFNQSGYAPIIVNDSYIGGAVRQFGNLSFSRIYQAGHSVASYQPETAFQVFARIIMGSSVSTGEPIDLGSYSSDGSANATETDTLPPQPSPTCWIRDFGSTCDGDAYDLAAQGKGVVINGVLYSSSADWPLATEASTTTKGAASTPSVALTGVFTATETPESGAAALISEMGGQWWAIGLIVVQCLFLAL